MDWGLDREPRFSQRWTNSKSSSEIQSESQGDSLQSGVRQGRTGMIRNKHGHSSGKWSGAIPHPHLSWRPWWQTYRHSQNWRLHCDLFHKGVSRIWSFLEYLESFKMLGTQLMFIQILRASFLNIILKSLQLSFGRLSEFNVILGLVQTSVSPWIPRFCVFKSVRLFGACLHFVIWLPCLPLCLYDFKFHIFSYKPLHQSIATQVYMVQGYRFSRNMDTLFFWEIHWTWYREATFSLITALDLHFSSIFLTFHIISWSHFVF